MILNEKTIDDSTDWTYEYDNKTMDPKLSAFGSITYYGARGRGNFNITVFNYTSMPIKTNYFSDEFRLLDVFGNNYMIEKPKFTSYPDESYINPISILTFSFPSLPLNINLLDKIIVGLGGRKENYIVLKRIPK